MDSICLIYAPDGCDKTQLNLCDNSFRRLNPDFRTVICYESGLQETQIPELEVLRQAIDNYDCSEIVFSDYRNVFFTPMPEICASFVGQGVPDQKNQIATQLVKFRNCDKLNWLADFVLETKCCNNFSQFLEFCYICFAIGGRVKFADDFCYGASKPESLLFIGPDGNYLTKGADGTISPIISFFTGRKFAAQPNFALFSLLQEIENLKKEGLK